MNYHRYFRANRPAVPMMRARISIDRDAEVAAESLRSAGVEPRRIRICSGSLSIFWSNGIAGTLTTLGPILAFWPLIAGLFGLMRRPANITEARP